MRAAEIGETEAWIARSGGINVKLMILEIYEDVV
jgi:hypothetical protein